MQIFNLRLKAGGEPALSAARDQNEKKRTEFPCEENTYCLVTFLVLILEMINLNGNIEHLLLILLLQAYT